MAPRKSPDGASRKPTGASVTTTPCTCQYLERASAEPQVPIVFDALTNEYHINNVGKNQGHTIIRHCPWCGGAAPRSKRESLFAKITQKEEDRLRRMTSGLRTIASVVKKLGKPDVDMEHGMVMKTPDSKDNPPTIKSYRTLHYKSLSKTAEVHFTDLGPDRGVRADFIGKPIQSKP